MATKALHLTEAEYESSESLLSQYQRVRQQSQALIRGLSEEDMLLQSMPDTSPTKWHLAHTSWFFETFLLQPDLPNYQPFDPGYQYLFNSYYDTLGSRQPRGTRGMLSRPTLDEVLEYRNYVDTAMETLLSYPDEGIKNAATIGLHHEMQHQELILTDIKHALSQNYFALPDALNANPGATNGVDRKFTQFDGGLVWMGTDAQNQFAYDCEQPRHRVFIQPFGLCNSPVTNGEWLDFIADGGYSRPELWLADGYACAQREAWQAPLYWQESDEGWRILTLHGYRFLDSREPVCHISYYEADAFARWAGYRLPTEFEWELAARDCAITGNFAERGVWQPQTESAHSGLQQIYGDVWEWTQSSFAPYPGFQAPAGALAEYNGKFMVNQLVLRGGSCATPQQQIRPSYRNFFYPHQRWQFSGLRLAR